MRFYYLTLMIVIFNLVLAVPSWFGFLDYQTNGDSNVLNESHSKFESMKDNANLFNFLLDTIKALWEVVKITLLAPYALYNNLSLFLPSQFTLIIVVPLSIVFYIGLFQMISNKSIEY